MIRRHGGGASKLRAALREHEHAHVARAVGAAVQKFLVEARGGGGGGSASHRRRWWDPRRPGRERHEVVNRQRVSTTPTAGSGADGVGGARQPEWRLIGWLARSRLTEAEICTLRVLCSCCGTAVVGAAGAQEELVATAAAAAVGTVSAEQRQAAGWSADSEAAGGEAPGMLKIQESSDASLFALLFGNGRPDLESLVPDSTWKPEPQLQPTDGSKSLADRCELPAKQNSEAKPGPDAEQQRRAALCP